MGLYHCIVYDIHIIYISVVTAVVELILWSLLCFNLKC